MTLPALTDPAVLVTAVASALQPYCDPGYAEEIARNAVQAMIGGDGALEGAQDPRVVIAEMMFRRARHVRHIVHASAKAAHAYAVAERPESQRERYLLATGERDPRGWLRAHGLLGVEGVVAA